MASLEVLLSPDFHQKLSTCSLAHDQTLHQILLKYVKYSLRYPDNHKRNGTEK